MSSNRLCRIESCAWKTTVSVRDLLYTYGLDGVLTMSQETGRSAERGERQELPIERGFWLLVETAVCGSNRPKATLPDK